MARPGGLKPTMKQVAFLLMCAWCLAGVNGATRKTLAAGGPTQVAVCHLEDDGNYKLLRVATSAWAGHAKHAGDCCMDAAVCAGRRCGTAPRPWLINDAAGTCTPTCPNGSHWDKLVLRCSDPCAGNPCNATRVAMALSNSTCSATPDSSLGYICGCVTGAEWANDALIDINGCVPNLCGVVANADLANSDGTCTDEPAPNTGYTCACNAGWQWNGTACADSNGCAPNLCGDVDKSNGTCTDEPAPNTGYKCACNAGWEWNGTACAASGPCAAFPNNGTRIDLPTPATGFKCGCAPGYAWDPATLARPGACVACMSVVAGSITGNQGYNGDGGNATDALLQSPHDVSVDADGNMYIADSANRVIRLVTAATGIITTLLRSNTTNWIFGVLAAPDGNVYYTDEGNNFHTYNPDTSGKNDYAVNVPAGSDSFTHGLALHPTSGLMHVMQMSYLRNTGYYSAMLIINLSTPTSADTATRILHDHVFNIAFNTSGDAFMPADRGHIYKWSGSEELEVWNIGDKRPTTGADATQVVFANPKGVAFDSVGNMLVTEFAGCRVWLIEAGTGQLRLVAGTEDDNACGGEIDPSQPLASQLYNPWGVAFGPEGRSVYIADAGNSRIMRVMLECVGA